MSKLLSSSSMQLEAAGPAAAPLTAPHHPLTGRHGGRIRPSSHISAYPALTQRLPLARTVYRSSVKKYSAMARRAVLLAAALLSPGGASAMIWHPKNPKNSMWDTWLFVQPGQGAARPTRVLVYSARTLNAL